MTLRLMPQDNGHCTQMGRWEAHRLRTRTNDSLHDTIPPGMDTCRPTRFSDLILVRGNNSSPRLNSSTHIFRHRTYTTFPWPCHTLHDTSPLGKDTCRPARPSYRNKARGNNNSSEQLPTRCCNPSGRTEKSLIAPQQHARHQPLGKGYGHVRSALGQEQATERQWPDWYWTMELQQHRDNGKKPQTLTESSTRQHRQSQADSDTHSMHSSSPVERHSPKLSATLHGETGLNNTLGANSSWSAQVQPFGDGCGHTDTTPGPVQSSKHCQKIFATHKRLGQTLYQERAAANLAEGCGQLAEFLAQFPWEEKRTGLGYAQLDVEQHLNSHNHTCHRVMQMLEDLPIEAIRTTVATKLKRLHSVIQLSHISEWPKAFLQPETSTPEFNLVISEIAEFETKRMGFLHMVKETILSVYDTLTNPDRPEPNNNPIRRTQLL